MQAQHNFIETRNDRDRALIDRCRTEQESIVREFREQADEHGVDQEPAPRVHTAHQQLADRCTAAMIPAHLVGFLVAFVWTLIAAPEKGAWIAAAFGFLYLVMAALLDLLAFSYPQLLMRRFRAFYTPPLVLSLLAFGILLVGRFASPELAAVLLMLDPYAWVTLEASMLVLGAVLSAAGSIFGWSGRLTRRYQALEQEIVALEQAIEKRSRHIPPPGAGAAAAAVALLLLFGYPVHAECPSVLVDRTGSIANQQGIESRLVTALAVHVSSGACVSLLLFADDVFGATKHTIHGSAPHMALFAPGRQANEQNARRTAETRLRGVLGGTLHEAACTSLPDMLMRAADEGSALLITDGQHTCTSYKPKPRTGVSPVIVLVRSDKDVGNQSDIYLRRREAILALLPHAKVLPEHKLDHAVESLIPASAPSLIKKVLVTK